MSSKLKLILAVCGLALFILIASVLYNVLIKGRVDGRLEEFSQAARVAATPSAETLASTSDAAVSSPSDVDATEEPLIAPDFTVFDVDGNEVKLTDLFSKPVIVNFWASWCPPCKSGMPFFENVYKEYGDEVVFMMIDMTDGSRETRENGEKFIADSGYTFPVYFDEKLDAARTYGVTSIPTTIFIMPDGTVAGGIQGSLDEKTLRYGIDVITSDGTEKIAQYNKITPEEAKGLMDKGGAIILDVRTEEEYAQGHIEGATLMPVDSIESRASDELPDKDALILVYCRSGNRSKTASQTLVSLGYNNVYDFGGINSWPYDTVK